MSQVPLCTSPVLGTGNRTEGRTRNVSIPRGECLYSSRVGMGDGRDGQYALKRIKCTQMTLNHSKCS
jgi:hypothetical protein